MSTPEKIAVSYLRYSKQEQSVGASTVRQMELANMYCERNNLTLDESVKYHDLGVSAYRGLNAKKALGQLIKDIDGGRIAKGSYLIVESLDRLSREDIEEALELFLSIIRKGIIIVTFSPNEHVFAKGKLDMSLLIIAIVYMSRAHEESALKSQRIIDAYNRRIAKMFTTPITSVCPFWLRVVKENDVRVRFENIPEKVAIVQNIYKWFLEGMGSWQISKKLNDSGIPSEKGKLWARAVITRLLKTRSVLGDFSSQSKIKNQAVINGKGYYPPIISEDDFKKVQTLLVKNRLKRQVGPVAKGCPNLFTGLLKMKVDGSMMRYVTTAKDDTFPPYLVSASFQEGKKGSNPLTYPYPGFEMVFLQLFKSLNPNKLVAREITGNEISFELKNLNAQLEVTTGKVNDIKKAIEECTKISPALFEVLSKAEARQLELEGQIKALEEKGSFGKPKASEFQGLIHLLDSLDIASDPDKLLDMRLRVRSALSDLIESITIDIYKKEGESPFNRYLTGLIQFRNGGKQRIDMHRSMKWLRIDGKTMPTATYFGWITQVGRKESELKVIEKTIYQPNVRYNQPADFVTVKDKAGLVATVRKGKEKLLEKLKV